MIDRVEFFGIVDRCVRAKLELRDFFFGGVANCKSKQEILSAQYDLASRLSDAINALNLAMSNIDHGDLVDGLNGKNLTFLLIETECPKAPGVYFAWDKHSGCLDYIGMSTNLRKRIYYSHNVIDFEKHIVAFVVADNPREIEKELIRINSPRLNKLS